MTAYTLPSGGTSTSSGITLNNGDTLTVNSGGTAISATVNSGGTAFVSAGGAMDSTSVNVSGFVYVSSGGVTTGTILSGLPNFMTEVFSSGTEVVFTGGSAINTTAFQAGKQIISGGMALDTTVTNGGEEDVLAGGRTTGTIAISGGVEEVSAGGVAVDATVSAGGFVYVSSGGLATDGFVANSGNFTIERGGHASGVTVSVGGQLGVADGGSAAYTVVSNGSYAWISAGGSATSTTVDNGGLEYVNGTETGAVVNAGSQGVNQLGLANGVAISTAVNGGGYQVISVAGTGTDTIVNAGGEATVFSGGTLVSATVNSGGFAVLSTGLGGVISDATISNGGYEIVYDTNSADGEATGTLLKPGGEIDVLALAYTSGGTVTLNSGTDVLTVSEGGQTYTQQLSGNYTGEYFHLSAGPGFVAVSGGGFELQGTVISLNDTPCYCRGTRILTDSGERPVEELRLGDKVVTKSGATRAIRWIGRRSYTGHYAASHHEVLPVLIKQSALADEVPRRDLWVSPLHAMLLEGMLVPAAALVNGISIVRAEAVEQLDYFHVELDTHDVIYAEGALAESFVDDDSRTMFHNAAQYQRLYPQALHEPARYCAPRVEEGEQLEALRRRLMHRAQGPAGGVAHKGRLLGCLDAVSRERIEGWAQNEAYPDEPVSLRVLDNGIVIGQVLADRYREDLQQAGIGDGRHSFSLTVPGGLSPLVRHVIQIQRVGDGQRLRDSPRASA